MAFRPGATNYQMQIESARHADSGLTEALRRKGEVDKQKRMQRAAKRSGLSKLVSAGLRGAAAYYTGGLSETMGGGKLIDDVALGKGAERNEYGDLVGLGASVAKGAGALRDKKIGEQDRVFESRMSRGEANVNRLKDMGLDEEALKAQSRLNILSDNYMKNRDSMKEKGFLGTGLGLKDEDYSGMRPTGGEISTDYDALQKRAREQALASQASQPEPESLTYDDSWYERTMMPGRVG